MARDNTIEYIIKLRDLTKAGVKSIVPGFKSVQSSAENLSKSVFNLQNSLAGIVIGAGVREAVKTFADFDDTMRTVGAISGATAKEFELLTAKAEELGSTTRFTASQAGEAFQYMAMSGMSVEDSLAGVGGVLELASANMMDLGEAANITTNVLSGMKLPIEDLARVNDVLTKAAFSANTNVSELGEGMKIAGPVAKASGMQIEEVVAVLGGLANNAIKGAEGGHAFKRMLIALEAPTKRQKTALAELGIETRNSDGTFRGMIPILKDLEKANLTVAQSHEVFGKFTMAAGIAAANSSKQIADLNVKLDNAGGTAAKAAKDMEAGLGGSLRAMRSAWEGLLIAVGRGLEPDAADTVQYFTDQIKSAREWIIKLSEDGTLQEWTSEIVKAIKQTFEYFKSMGSLVLDLSDKFSPLLNVALDLAPAFIAFAGAAGGVAVALKSVGAFVGGLAFAFETLGFKAIFAGEAVAGMNLAGLLGQAQRSTQVYGLMSTALTSVKGAALIASGALGAAGLGAVLGTLLNEIEAVQYAAQYWIKTLDEMGVFAPLAFMGVKVGAEQSREELDNLVKITDQAMKKFQDFKDVKIPPDIADMPLKSLTELNGELKKSKVYWDSYLTQLKATSDGSAESAAEINAVSKRLSEISAALKITSGALKDYGNDTIKSLSEANEAHKNHIDQIKSHSAEFIKIELENRKKAIAEQAELYKQDKISYEEFTAKKAAVVEASEKEIKNIRLEFAGQIQDSANEELRIATETKEAKLAIVRDEIAAGIISREDGAARIAEIETQAATEAANIKKGIAQQYQTELSNIEQEEIKRYIQNQTEKASADQAAFEKQILNIDLLEAQKTITEQEAFNKRAEASETYYQDQVDKATEAFEKVKDNYKDDSEEFKIALKIKEEAEKAHTENQIAINDERNKKLAEKEKQKNAEIKAMEEAHTALLQAEYEKRLSGIDALEKTGVISHADAIKQKLQAEVSFAKAQLQAATETVAKLEEENKKGTADYVKALTEKLQAETDYNQKVSSLRGALVDSLSEKANITVENEDAKEKIEETNQEFIRVKKVISTPIPIDFDIEPAMAASNILVAEQRKKAEEAYQNAAQAAKAMGGLWNEYIAQSGSAQRNLMLQNFKDMERSYEQYMAEYNSAHSQMIEMQGQNETDKIAETIAKEEEKNQILIEGLEQRLLKIKDLKEKDFLTDEQYIEKKLEVEKALAEIKIQSATDAIAKAADLYKTDSIEYVSAVTAKMEAENALTGILKEANNERLKIEEDRKKAEEERKKAEEEALKAEEEAWEKKESLLQESLDKETARYNLFFSEVEQLRVEDKISEEEALKSKLEGEAEFSKERLKIAEEGLKNAQDRYGWDTEEYFKAFDKKVQAEIDFTNAVKEQAELRQQAETEAREAAIAKEEEKNQILIEGFEQQLLKLKELREKDFLSEGKYTEQRLKIETDFNQAKLEIVTQAMASAAELYGEDSIEYANSVTAKIEAEKTLTETIQAELDRRREIEKAAEKAKTEKLTAEYEQKFAELENLRTADILSEEQYTSKKFDLKKKWLQFQIEGTEAVIKEAIDLYGRDSAEYIRATTEKIKAETALKEKIKEVRAAASEKTEQLIEIKGKASPVRPFSETITAVIGKLKEVQNTALQGAQFKTTFTDALNGAANIPAGAFQAPQAATPAAGNGLKIKDYGKAELQIGNKGFEVMSESNVIEELTTALRWNRLTK